MYQFYTVKYPPEIVSWCLYALFVDDIEWIKRKCNCEMKSQTHGVAYNLNRNLSAISSLATEKLHTQILQTTTMSMSGPHFN